jgi:hypothetical protein
LELFGVKFLAIFPDILAFSFVVFTPKISKISNVFSKKIYHQVGKILQRKIHCSKYHTYYINLIFEVFYYWDCFDKTP